jgi:signal transduction histidine kinase
MAAAAAASRAARRSFSIARRARLVGLLFLLLVVLRPGAPVCGANSETSSAAAPPGVTGPPPSVLVLYPDNRLLPANVLFDDSFRQRLGSATAEPIDCFSEFLDELYFPEHHQERMRDFLGAKYSERPPDVIVAFAPPSLEFCLRHRARLFRDVPLVFAALGTSVRDLPSESEPRVTGVQSEFDGPATLRLALRLHPRTRQVYVVEDSAAHDSTGLLAVQRAFQGSDLQPTFHRLANQPLQLLEALARLPENSLVLDLSMFGIRAETTVPPREMAQRLARASRAPIYAAYDPYVGSGYVGAVTTPMTAIGRETAQLVVQVLARRGAGELPAVRTLAATPVFDWRELRRWGIRARQLPAGSIVQFQPPSLWQQHSVFMITVSALFLLQSGLILALVLQSRRRRRAEREAQRRRQELAHMTRVATMGELTASLAHEINQPLTAILSNAQAGQRLLAAGGADVEMIKEILADIAADDQRAGEVIRRMRALLRKGESDPTILDVNDIVTEVVGLIHGEMILQNVTLGLDLSPQPRLVHGDRIQLQQVLLNLMMNALDAMRDTSGSARRMTVHTAATNGRAVEVSVEDSGAGVPADKLEGIFEPFVTTKSHGMGLGLAICRSIIQAHGGRIGSKSNAGGGATFWFTLPAATEAKL